ncbi:membrane dipeptidase [Nocardia cyriacigeorgica]|uniref:Membrane dipeptidase n=2 Tax=Nocardia cyriacigeorgica TaxID=135487 RepID=A0A6P1D8S8_9NOCA|nr:membrane dipeptidase [Nocardia cyriacigeorgica]NEW39593.1 membrane dipeptidase [Nocardia cyriacigeorgica]NEW44652.1 membrane dipeptidase [Nocardia cyriacigeorgica]NEW50081.1 membrane dipeptidase [Nocardia cyriacigeorgica]NEW59551.1 membrane dipeptidase [Nocardia cyriacigeorgica]
MPPFLWEQHSCLPLLPTADITELARYPLGSYLSVNVGYSPQSSADSLALLHKFRDDALADGRFRLVTKVSEIGDPDTIALAFDLEDAGPLDGDLDNVARFRDLGVRSLLPTYNHANAAGAGCLDAEDTGLTAYGRDLVRALNVAGVFVDGSHCSRRTGLDLAEHTDAPMIYGHANFDTVWAHPRNISDEQAKACADTGGVIGINGVGIFLGHNGEHERAERVRAMADHIEYGAELVGIEHIGIGSDYSFDADDFNHELRTNPGAFSEAYTRWGPLQWTPPEDLLGTSEISGLDEVLAARGLTESDRAAVFGGNFRRIAEQVWRA